MSAVPRWSMTRAEFLEWEERQEERYEFDGVRVRSRAGGTAAHAFVQVNLLRALTGNLRGTPWRPVGSLLKVATAEGYRYPDAFVVGTPVPARGTVVTEPVVVFEIVDTGSAEIDFTVKNAEYWAIPSVRRYVVLQQERAAAAVFVRRDEDWVSELVAGEDAVLAMPEIGVELALAEIYRDVELVAERGNVMRRDEPRGG